MVPELEEIQEFSEQVGSEYSATRPTRNKGRGEAVSPAAHPDHAGDFNQWAVFANGVYQPSGPTAEKLPSGLYEAGTDNYGRLLLTLIKVVTDELVETPDLTCHKIIDGIRLFWGSEPEFRKRKILFKRGILLWGPAGSGKSSTIMLLLQELKRLDGVALLTTDPKLCARALREIRQVEPARPLVNIVEDVDALVEREGEQDLLALLDGENQVENIVHIATTNYPERLDPRFVNRPSRFDQIEKVGMPSKAARRAYFERLLTREDDVDLERWVEETDGLSLAHLREIVVAVTCLGRSYEETLERLKRMRVRPQSKEELTNGVHAGFGVGV